MASIRLPSLVLLCVLFAAACGYPRGICDGVFCEGGRVCDVKTGACVGSTTVKDSGFVDAGAKDAGVVDAGSDVHRRVQPCLRHGQSLRSFLEDVRRMLQRFAVPLPHWTVRSGHPPMRRRALCRCCFQR